MESLLHNMNRMSTYETILHITNPYVNISSHIAQYESYDNM